MLKKVTKFQKSEAKIVHADSLINRRKFQESMRNLESLVSWEKPLNTSVWLRLLRRAVTCYNNITSSYVRSKGSNRGKARNYPRKISESEGQSIPSQRNIQKIVKIEVETLRRKYCSKFVSQYTSKLSKHSILKTFFCWNIFFILRINYSDIREAASGHLIISQKGLGDRMSAKRQRIKPLGESSSEEGILGSAEQLEGNSSLLSQI